MHHRVEIVITFYYPFLSTFKYLSGQACHLSLNIKIYPPPEGKELFLDKVKKEILDYLVNTKMLPLSS